MCKWQIDHFRIPHTTWHCLFHKFCISYSFQMLFGICSPSKNIGKQSVLWDSRIDGKYNSGGSYRFVFYTHLYGIVFDVKVTGGSSEVCWVKVAGSLIKPDHLCFVQMTRCVCDQVSPMLMQKGIFLCKTHVKNHINFVVFYYLSEYKC